MGSVNETIKEVVDFLRQTEGRKVGCVVVHLYRPFSVKHLLRVIPKTVKKNCCIRSYKRTRFSW